MDTLCINCGSQVTTDFCPECGQKSRIHRISISHLAHEVAHTFWHLEKGIIFTLKELALHPGQMQQSYLAGYRVKYQKPFSFFAITGTICALALYLIYKNAPNKTEEAFYKQYYFLVQAALVPFYALTTYLLFRSPRLYYAEALVMNVYMLGFMSVCIIPINLLSFFLPNGPISLMEIAFLLTYNIWTYLKFFREEKMGWVIVKSVVCIIASYILFQYVSRMVMAWLL